MKNKVLPLIATMLLGFFNLLSAQQTNNPQSGDIKSTSIDKLSPGDEFKKVQQLFIENQLSHAAHQHKNGDRKSQHFRLTKDINDLAHSSPVVRSTYLPTPRTEFPVAGNIAFFSAEDGIHGIELWRTDGTTAGTYIVKDINPGERDILILNMVAINGKVYFSASKDGYNFYPWVSDGTESGTFAIDSTDKGRTFAPHRFGGLNDDIYIAIYGFFSDQGPFAKVNDDLHGFTFINAGSSVSELTAVGDLLFFTASSSALWRTDGTEAGTYKLTDLNISSRVTSYLTAYNNKLYFLLADATGFKLGVSDGTIAGTGLAPGNNGITIPTDNFYEHFPVLNNVLFLSGNNQAGKNGLYKYDAANSEGLVLVKDNFSGIIDNSGFEVGNNNLYFLVSNPSTGIRQLWRSDGTDAGTTLIRSLEPSEFISPLHFYLGNLYFVLHDGAHGSEVWKSDGTVNGTAIIKDINPGSDNSVSIPLTECNGKVVFIANEFKSKTGIELWATNGTAAGTKLLKDINTRRTPSSSPLQTGSATLNDEIIFSAEDSVHGYELYISDGSEKGTKLLNDIRPGASGSLPSNFQHKNGEVYFVAYPNDFNHPTIYKTNGKPGGLRKITSYYRGFNDENLLRVTDKGLVFYKIRNQVSLVYELWRSNGSSAGTFKVADKFGGLIETVGNSIYFTVGDYATGFELWKSDGSIAGTKKFWNISSNPHRFFSFRDRLYFSTIDENSNTLWKTDGTSNGTFQLVDIPGAFSFLDPFVTEETLYFTAPSLQTSSVHLWKTNGTVAGTKELEGEFSDIHDLGDVNGDLFFLGKSAEESFKLKLWKLPCRSSSIESVKDLSTNTNILFAGAAASAGDKYFFLIYIDELIPGIDAFKQILWSSDGTASGTGPIDEALLSSLIFINNFTSVDDKLFFTADSYQYGNELFVGMFSRKHKDRNHEHKNVAKPGDNVLEKDASTNDKLRIYPNPTTNSITVFFQQVQSNDLIITINDQAGRVMMRKKVSTQKGTNSVSFNVESLPAGTYVIKFSDKKDRVSKFVKE